MFRNDMPKRGTDYSSLLARVKYDPDGLLASPVGEWTLNKLALLSYYLPAFAKICHENRGGWYYLDAFAGSGANSASGSGRYKGSALIGLTTDPPPTMSLLIESERATAAILETRCASAGRAHAVVTGNCNEELPHRLDAFSDRTLPAFCLFDPFATELEWRTVELVARRRQHIWPYELLIYFPTQTVARIAAVQEERQRAVHEAALDALFGTPEWREIADRQRAGRLRAQEPGLLYLDLYKSRIKALGYLPPVDRSVMRAAGGLMYHLIFATGNENGLKIMNEGLKRAFLSTLPLALDL